MKFPYGICNFYDIITEGYYYADRTDRIPLIEEAGKHLLFLRPRRFGKSLLLSTLENYYDMAKADEFDRLFGHLFIGKNPTPKHSSYFVMKWDFSTVDPEGNTGDIKRSMHNHINGCIEKFLVRYQEHLGSVTFDTQDCLRSFQSVMTAVSQTPHKLYLLIDEYDNFANEVLMTGHSDEHRQKYKTLLYGEGTVKTVFKAVKAASAGQGLDRVFITGVSPVVLSDITSGYNIAENIYLDLKFNDLCGFSEEEITDVLAEIVRECDLAEEEAENAADMMQTFYNAYCFSPDAEQHVYNPTLALFFMKKFQENCRYPQNMLDSNLAMDRGKIRYISDLPKGEEIIIRALNDDSSMSVRTLADRFGVEDMLTATKDRNFMLSLLYYFGVLTFSSEKTEFGDSVLKIPNLAIRKLYAERIREMFLPGSGDEIVRTARNFYKTGEMGPLCRFIEEKYFKVFDNRDYRWANELTVKTAFLTLLFDDTFYIMDSETSLERGYADMTMIVRPDMRQYPLLDFLMEFKYVSLKDAELTGDQAKKMGIDELKKLPLVRQKFLESKTKLEDYRGILLSQYGDLLRLRTYAVVSLGFERLVWEESAFNPKIQNDESKSKGEGSG
ncbi:MAG: AAA family ATPase [Desulfococcaceae bacterium]